MLISSCLRGSTFGVLLQLRYESFKCASVCVCVRVCPCAEDVEDDAGYLDVAVSDVKHPPAQLSPMPEGLSSQQVCMCV